jgi:hypothetical protein
MPHGFTVSARNVLMLSRGKFSVFFSGDATHARQRNLIQNGWYLHMSAVEYTHIRQKHIVLHSKIDSYRRLWARPGLRRAAIVPCLFIPLDLGRGVMPFETLQRSRRDPLGP